MSEPAVHAVVDLDRYPLGNRGSVGYQTLVDQCQAQMAAGGSFDLPGFVLPTTLQALVGQLGPLFMSNGFVHRRRHNIYFEPAVAGLAADHPALTQMETSNRTLCADDLAGTALMVVYQWAPFRQFLADALQLGTLYPMDDPLAKVNVMEYHNGEALNWHFDRSQFTTTLLLQRPHDGGRLQLKPGLRAEANPNHEGVGRLVTGLDTDVIERDAQPGTLNVFAGHDTAHRVTPVIGSQTRIVAVFSYFLEPDVRMTAAERLGFYGRTTARPSS